MRHLKLAFLLLACAIPVAAQTDQLKTAEAVLEKYKRALGGVDAISKLQSMTVHGEVESSAGSKATLVYYAAPFKTLFKVKTADGTEITSGFDGSVSWSVSPKGASIDSKTPLGAARRDADLQYPLHQPDYFKTLELAGVTDFEGRRCYWLHGITKWGKDNNQFYDVETGLLAGYRFQADASGDTVIALFQEYKNFGGPLIATKHVFRSGGNTQTTMRFESVTYDPLPGDLFDLPAAVKALVK